MQGAGLGANVLLILGQRLREVDDLRPHQPPHGADPAERQDHHQQHRRHPAQPRLLQALDRTGENEADQDRERQRDEHLCGRNRRAAVTSARVTKRDLSENGPGTETGAFHLAGRQCKGDANRYFRYSYPRYHPGAGLDGPLSPRRSLVKRHLLVLASACLCAACASSQQDQIRRKPAGEPPRHHRGRGGPAARNGHHRVHRFRRHRRRQRIRPTGRQTPAARRSSG